MTLPDSECRQCPICGNLRNAVPLEHGHSLLSIQDRASAGCETCLLLSRAVLALESDNVQADDIKVAWDTMRIQGLRIVVGSISLSEFRYGIDMYADHGKMTPWQQSKYMEMPSRISGHTGSEKALSLAKRWIRNCDQDHGCRILPNAVLPTRLLDVRDVDKVFIYCPEKGERGVYACLSHCWGAAPTLRTTSDNLEAHKVLIAWDTLPKTFQEAIKVVSTLGIHYVWIDSLCILQDVQIDWQTESAKMADIYANSALTIAASLAEKDSDPLFVESPSVYRSVFLENVAGSDVFIRKTLGHGHGPVPLPLMRRAWVLQERLLSPRVIHFTHEELVWECMEQTTCECGCIRSLWSPGHVPFDKDLLYDPVLGRASRTEAKDRWRQLVHEYSRLQLTFDRDRLPAISGAARRFSRYIEGDYLAGLWRDGLATDLLWERKASNVRPQYLAGIPSWSWMSVGLQVTYDECMAADDLAAVVSASCQTHGEDVFGEIVGGEVRLATALSPLSLFLGSPDVLSVSDQHADVVKTGRHGVVEVILDDASAEPNIDMMCARIALRRGVYRHGSDEEVWLVLAPALQQGSSYNRIGILKLRRQHGSSAMQDTQFAEPETVVIL